MNRSQQVWRRYIDAWNRHDVDAILDNVTDDFIYDERPATMDRPLQGRRAFRAYLERPFTAFPDLRIEVTSCEAGSTLAVSESIMRGTHLGSLGGLSATRRRVTTRVAFVFCGVGAKARPAPRCWLWRFGLRSRSPPLFGCIDQVNGYEAARVAGTGAKS